MTDLQFRILQIGHENGESFLPINRFTSPRNLEGFAIGYTPDDISKIFRNLYECGLFEHSEESHFKLSPVGKWHFESEETKRIEDEKRNQQLRELENLQNEQIKSALRTETSVRKTNIFVWISGALTLIVTTIGVVIAIMVYKKRDDEIHQIQSKGLEQEVRELRKIIQDKTNISDSILTHNQNKSTSK